LSAAARGAAGYLYASGRLRHLQRDPQMAAERAAEALKKDRQAKSFSTAGKARRRS